MASGHTDVLVLRNVTKRWPGVERPVLDAVDLDVPAGTLSVIEGENGAGKTTLLRIVAGMLDADAGEVRVCDRRAEDDRTAYQADLGVVSAGNTGLYNRLNSLQHLQFAARLAFVERPRRRPQVRQMFDRFGLMDFGGRRVDRLSMGQRQRLRLAMAFVHEPSLLLLDEPTTSLDAAGVGLLAEALQDHVAAGRSALWLGPTGADVPVTASRRWSLVSGRATA